MAVFLRNRLHYALNYTEVKKIVKQRLIKVDGRVRTHHCFPTGFMGNADYAYLGFGARSDIKLLSLIIYLLLHPRIFLQMWSHLKRRVSTSGCCTMWRAASWCTRLQARRPSTSSVKWNACTPAREVCLSLPLTTAARFAIPTRSSRRTIPFSLTSLPARFVSSSSLSPVRFHLKLSTPAVL